jgi:hypothetical protein
MKRAQSKEDIIERPASVLDSKTGEIFELDLAPVEIQQRLKERVTEVWYRYAVLAVKRDLNIDFQITKVDP